MADAGRVSKPARRGVYEFVFGGLRSQREELLAFWAMLGFQPVAEGTLSARQAGAFYGHASDLLSIRLEHPGCASFGTGLVRLQLWRDLRDGGLGLARPLSTGSRWMGLYTHDVLQLRDAFAAERDSGTRRLWLSPLVAAPLVKPAPPVDFQHPLVGLREQLVFGEDFRLAFIQRAGFERPGFGTFDNALPYRNTEGSHANIVQPANAFDTDFYKAAFGFETAPYGEAHESGDEESTIAALDLDAGELFYVERIRARECPAGLLQVYSSYVEHDDLREQSRAGSRNLCLYSLRLPDPDGLAASLTQSGGRLRAAPAADEFGNTAVYFDAPDGYAWLAIADDG